MRSGQFCSRGTTLADCWLSKEDQRDSLGGKSPEKCFLEESFGRVAPWSEEAEEDKDNREEVAEEQFEEDVQGVHGVPGENSVETKVFSSFSTIKPCGENADALTKGDHSGPGGRFEIKRDQDLDLMKSSGMAGRTVMTTRESRRYLHS